MKKAMFIFLIVVSGTCVFAQQQPGSTSAKSDAEKTVKHRVVIQLSSSDTLVWKGLMNNLKNLKEGWGETVEIEVVAHSTGIEMLMIAKTTEQKKITEFKTMGIVFVACQNTMKAKKITKEEIVAEAGYVPMGVGEIIMKEEQGWSYLKSGF
ncbi:hypothetical protein BH10BAC3_BH10BAC3_35720 [soil metagenome]